MDSTKTLTAAPAGAAKTKRKTAPAKGAALRWVVMLGLVLILGGGAAWYFLGPGAQAQSQTQSGVTTSTAVVRRGDITLTASGSGTLSASQAVNMSFSTSGKVAELSVKLGDTVKTGDVLAQLEKAEDLEANLAAAQANLLQAQQALAALQKSAGSTLAKAYQGLVTAQAAYDEALAASQRTVSSRCSIEVLNKYRTAYEQAAQKLNDLSLQDPASDAVTIARYDYDTSLANYTYCQSYTATEKDSAQFDLDVARLALQEAEDEYNTLKEASGIDPDLLSMNETRVETTQTLVTTAQEALDGITLKAPIDGKITYLAAAVGAMVDTTTFLTISDISHPVVSISLDETDMDKLVEGNTAQVVFSALPNQPFTGQVSLANPEMVSFGPFRAASGQIELGEDAVKALENLPLGLSAAITITGKEAKDVLLVPVAALKQQNNGDYSVKVVGKNGELTQQVVTIGLQDGTYAEITSGLAEGVTVSYTTTADTSSAGEGQNGEPFMGGGMPPMQ